VSATKHDNKEEEVNNYNVELLREFRLRGYYGDRYDWYVQYIDISTLCLLISL
jgi:hypothetical protein